jgi:signal transduction histidine kinase
MQPVYFDPRCRPGITARFWAVALLCCCLCATAQARHHLQLGELLRKAAEASGTRRVDLLNSISWHYRKYHPDSSLRYAQEAYALAKESGYYDGECKALSFMGVAHNYLIQYEDALRCFNQALAIAMAHRDSVEVAFNYNNIGNVHHARGDQAEAYRYQEMALSIFENMNHAEGMGYVYQSMARTYRSDGNLEKGIAFSEKALELRQSDQRGIPYITSLQDLAEMLIEAGRYADGLARLQEARLQSEAIGSEAMLARCNQMMAMLCERQEEYVKALLYAKKALQQQEHMENPYERYRTQLLMGRIYLVQGQLREAEYYLAKVLAAVRGQIPALEVEALLLLAELHERRSDYARALYYHKRYQAGKDTIAHREKAHEMQLLRQNMAIMQRERELERLRVREAQQQERMATESKKTVMLLGATMVGAVLLAILMWSNRRKAATNRLLSHKNEEIERQRQAIEAQNAALQETNRQLERSYQEQESLMGVVAHDLKSPLNKVKGYTQILKLLGGMSEEQRKIVEGIDKAVEAGRNLIRDLLDVSAIQHADAQMNIQAIVLGELLQGIVESFEASAGQKSIDIIYTEPEVPVSIASDRSALLRIFENLISNAVKFSPDGKRVFISLHNLDGQAQVLIRDEGPGFTPEDQQRAFQRFQKLSAQPTGGESSTGLGLAIVKVLVEKVGGKISLYSAPGEGAEFILEFPAQTPNINA